MHHVVGTKDWAPASGGNFQMTMPKSRREMNERTKNANRNQTTLHRFSNALNVKALNLSDCCP